MRKILNAIFYVLRGGIAWRSLPRDLPPGSLKHQVSALITILQTAAREVVQWLAAQSRSAPPATALKLAFRQQFSRPLRPAKESQILNRVPETSL